MGGGWAGGDVWGDRWGIGEWGIGGWIGGWYQLHMPLRIANKMNKILVSYNVY